MVQNSNRARKNLKSSLRFGTGLNYDLSGALPSGSEQNKLPGREIYLAQTIGEEI